LCSTAQKILLKRERQQQQPTTRKTTNMKKITLKSLVSTMALAALILTPASLSAQPRASLEGAWDAQVTATDCNGNILLVFRAFTLYHEGGTSTSTTNTSSALQTAALGTWQRTGMRTFNAPLQDFGFNPDGSFASTAKIERQIHLSADGNSYTGTATIATYDPDGNLIFSACATEVATRLP
jgi:hypothetical protein